MRKKREMQILLIMLLTVALICGCSTKEEQNNEQKVEGVEIEEDTDTYRFVDVLGNEYEAELLDIPLITQDLTRIEDQDGKKFYLDEDGETASRLGIDVSEYQPEVDWQQVKDYGVDFVIVRLGYRGYGEAGKLVEDSMFRSHVEGALAAGLDVGVYFFSQAVNKEEAEEEAQFVLERIRDYDIKGPVVYDTEEIKNDTARTDDLDGKAFTDHCITFCDAVKAAGYETMIYANMKWMAFTLDLTRLTDYEKWYADYEPLPQCPYEISMWQYTETGQVPGINGNVDMNLWFL